MKKNNYIFFFTVLICVFFMMKLAYASSPPPEYFFYKSMTKISNIPSNSLPQVVELTLPNEIINQNSPVLILDDILKTPVNYHLATYTSPRSSPIYTIQVIQPSGQNGSNLTDNTNETFVDLPAESISENNNSLLKISATARKKLNINGISLQFAQNSSQIFFITVWTPQPDGTKKLLISQSLPISSTLISFPQIEAQDFEIQLSHKQPLRITEVEPRFIDANDNIFSKKTVRFLTQSNHTYTFYADKDIAASSKNYNTESQLANPVGNKIVEATLSVFTQNPLYTLPDTDNDSVPNIRDNCPTVSNLDQKDENNNGIGDVCDDFDQDGIFNTQDNCPTIPNPYQEDKDGDKIGDVCDGVESRISEKYPWLPWVGILVGFIFTGGILVISLKQKPTKPS